LRSFLHKTRGLITEQLMQGASPERLAAGIAVAAAISIFPLLDFSTFLCLVFGYGLKLNQPLLQAVNYLLYPLQLLLMPIFLRLGEWIFNQPPAPFSPAVMVRSLFAAPGVFLQTYGKAGALAVLAWAIIVPAICVALYFFFRQVFRQTAKRLQGKNS
jgi:uncharacterized protein (DUF2062 family)